MAAGPTLVRAGFGVTIAGLVLGLVALLPLVTSVELPSLFWSLAMLLGLGLGVILVGLAVQARHRSRVQRSAVAAITRHRA